MAVELSVAMIFKNEIRCLERCLKSLQPLRERLSCEIVMADTGSTDGSREIAERYADVVFDFPWINDFSAARNAALERCKGKWALVLDCDEWLDESAPEAIKKLLHGNAAPILDCVQLRMRSYTSEAFDRYVDCYLSRLFKRSGHVRYAGAIHETPEWTGTGEMNLTIAHGILVHHDGYVMLNNGSEEGVRKKERNRALLREELNRSPDSLLAHIRFLESALGTEEDMQVARKLVELIERRVPEWEMLGPVAMTRVVEILPEFDQWTEMAHRLFPQAYVTRIDVNYEQTIRAADEKDSAKAIRCGEAYLQACADAEIDIEFRKQVSIGVTKRNIPFFEQFVRIILAEAYHETGRDEKVVPVLKKLDWDVLIPDGVVRVLTLLGKLGAEETANGADLVTALWNGACAEGAKNSQAERCKQAFLAAGERLFESEESAWRILLPLRGACILGDAAALMACETPEEADALLAAIETLPLLPARAFVHALKLGAAFPLPKRRSTVEEMDALAQKLAEDEEFLHEALLFAASAAETEQDLLWARALGLAVMQSSDAWVKDENAFELLCAFARIESLFLPWYYAESALKNPGFLPPMHRFALHLANAFAVLFPAALDAGFAPSVPREVRAALSELRRAVEAVPAQKALVDLVLDRLTQENGKRP